jgi:hypothetical protein
MSTRGDRAPRQAIDGRCSGVRLAEEPRACFVFEQGSYARRDDDRPALTFDPVERRLNLGILQILSHGPVSKLRERMACQRGNNHYSALQRFGARRLLEYEPDP